MKYHTADQDGFTLVETLVAVTILLLVIVGPMTISSSVARSTSFSSEQVVAFFLAQEGAEIAQKARDDLLLANFNTDPQVAWDKFTNTTTGIYRNCYNNTTQGCALQLLESDTKGGILVKPQVMTMSPQVFSCAPEKGGFGGKAQVPICQLRYDSTGERARYQYPDVQLTLWGGNNASSDYPATPYTRVVLFEKVDTNQVKVTSRVTWRTSGQRKEQKVEVVTYLFNVYGN